MDDIWDCMNVASRIVKQIENSDNLVPKNAIGADTITPMQDLQELLVTIQTVRSILMPFVTSSRKSKAVGNSPFEICMKGIKESLNALFSFMKDLEKEFSIYTWKTQKVKIYQMDFLIKQKLDQFSALFNLEDSKDSAKKEKDESKKDKDSVKKEKDESKKDKDSKKEKNASNSGSNKDGVMRLIEDPEGKEFWINNFGNSTLLVPWNSFLTAFETYSGSTLKDDEESIKMIIGFTKTDHVSIYEFGIFLKWFGPMKSSCQRLLESLREGLLCGFVPAVEANLLLEGKRDGTFLIRCSKTHPGSFAVTFIDNSGRTKHCLLYNVAPSGLTLKNPPTVFNSLKEFVSAHTGKLKQPLGNQLTMKKKLPGFAYDGKIPEGPENPDNNNTGNSSIEGSQCIVCMDAPMETVFLECGHLACCAKCSMKLKICPICRNNITRVIPIFRAN